MVLWRTSEAHERHLSSQFFSQFFSKAILTLSIRESFSFAAAVKDVWADSLSSPSCFLFSIKKKLPGQLLQQFAAPVQWQIVHFHFWCYILLKNLPRRDYTSTFSFFWQGVNACGTTSINIRFLFEIISNTHFCLWWWYTFKNWVINTMVYFFIVIFNITICCYVIVLFALKTYSDVVPLKKVILGTFPIWRL